MNFEQRIKGIQKWIEQEEYLDETIFDKEKLVKQKYLNFQIDDCYDYLDIVEGKTRKEIFKLLYNTYLTWKIKLMELGIPFYLGVWIYDPRLPKSEIVCAIGDERINYYQNQCFDVPNNPKNIIDLKDFKQEKGNLVWSQKIDSDTLDEWEINFPKENYESQQLWLQDQEYFKNFINDSYKVEEKDNGKQYFRNVGEIWTGEMINN
ncbi:hypothetical protein [Mangrovimonas sp. DI 80]|uniref:hypothetical protein n=1 Tax=Mangrovimonas sp. DI 80 TaxID=1779330 RepID=UPI0009758DAD|nr:hypothetical protein [Mangrovimonas sp. DI 80]OMP29682.1 hypothetical protein BKM32_16280 [Mangrovimonas sp. DI 80]